MTPNKAPTVGAKGKNKVVVEVEIALKCNFVEMQYPEGMIVGKEWVSHLEVQDK